MDKQYFINKLSINRPTNFEKYNYDLLPETFKAFDKLSIECFKHGIFNQNAGSHLFGQGCPDCGKKQSENNRALTTNEFINKSKAKYGDKFDYSKTKENDEIKKQIIKENNEYLIIITYLCLNENS